MFKFVLIILSAVIVVLIILLFFNFYRNSDIDLIKPDQDKKTITINDREIIVEIADEPNEQTRGLSGRESLLENEGMLFIFPQPATPSFWMKEMKFAIDIIWLDAASIIVGIQKNVSPDTFPQTFFPPSPIKYVLEVNAGWSERNKIKAGTKVVEL